MSSGERTQDAGFMEKAFRDLILTGAEFPIRVEGVKSLPYTAVLVRSETSGRTLEMKLFRPLPPALPAGARFDMVFSALGKRYEGQITLVGRAGYLQYKFQWPRSLLSSDRRLWRRYPFRPRENVFVIAQDGQIPCYGLTGPLVNLSMGGLMFRVDRMVRLEDGMPVRPEANRFVEGRSLSLLRILGLSKTGALEPHGKTVRVDAHDSAVHLAVSFNGMSDDDRELLTQILEERGRKSVSGSTRSAAPSRFDPEPEPEPEEAGEAPEPVAGTPPEPAAPGAEVLRRLDRRTSRLLVVAKEGEVRDDLVRGLRAWGFWRLDLEPDLFAAHARYKEQDPPYHLLVMDLESSHREGLEAVGAVRHLEPLLASFGDLPVAFALRQPDPVLGLLDKPNRGAVALEDPDPAGSLGVMDRLVSLVRSAGTA